jgi:hypothetical protein
LDHWIHHLHYQVYMPKVQLNESSSLLRKMIIKDYFRSNQKKSCLGVNKMYEIHQTRKGIYRSKKMKWQTSEIECKTTRFPTVRMIVLGCSIWFIDLNNKVNCVRESRSSDNFALFLLLKGQVYNRIYTKTSGNCWSNQLKRFNTL